MPSYHRQYGTSPVFVINNPSITSGGIWIHDIANRNKEALKYIQSGGLNHTTITNNSTSNIVFYPNQQREGWLIPANTIRTYSPQDMVSLTSFTIEEKTGSSIGVGEITINTQRVGADSESMMQRVHSHLFGPEGDLI